MREYEDENVTGELMAEVAAQGLAVEVAETGETRFTHSGGEVVLRCKPGLDNCVVRAWGQGACDEARLCTLGRAIGLRVESWVRSFGRSVGPCCRIGERLGVVAWVATDSGEEFCEQTVDVEV